MRPARVLIAILIAYFHVFDGGGSLAAGWGALAQETADAGAAGSAPAGDASSADGDLVIPPGQEQLLAEMLGQGAELPDGCQMISGQIEYRVVKARYKCPAGEVVVELIHPSRAAATAPRTERFAITIQSGSPPGSLLSALESRIRSKEAAFQWQLLVAQPERAGDAQGTFREQFAAWVRLAVALLFVIAVIAWIVRKRGARQQSAS